MFKNKLVNIAILFVLTIWGFWQTLIVQDSYRRIFFPILTFLCIFALLMTIFDIKPGRKKQ